MRIPPIVPPMGSGGEGVFLFIIKGVGVCFGGFVGFFLFAIVATLIEKAILGEETGTTAAVIFAFIGVLFGAGIMTYLLFF